MKFKKIKPRDLSSISSFHSFKRDSVVRRIIFLFDRLTIKFKHNKALWKEYFAFCLQIQSKKQLFRAVTKSLKFNSHELFIWLTAIYFEFEVNQNPFSARRLFLRCMQMNSGQPRAWIEYARFEMKFIEKVSKRKELLGLNDETQEKYSIERLKNSFKSEQETNEDFISLKLEKRRTENGLNNPGKFVNEEDTDIFFQDSSLINVIVDSAIEAFTKEEQSEASLDKLREVLLGILRLVTLEFQFEWCSEVRSYLETKINEIFQNCVKTKTELYKLSQSSDCRNTIELIKKAKNLEVKKELMLEFMNEEVFNQRNPKISSLKALTEFPGDLFVPFYSEMVRKLYESFRNDKKNIKEIVLHVFQKEEAVAKMVPDDNLKLLVMKGESDENLVKFFSKLPKVLGNLSCFKLFVEHLLKEVETDSLKDKAKMLKKNLTLCFAFPMKEELAVFIKEELLKKEKKLRRDLLDLMVSLGTICPSSIVAENIEIKKEEVPFQETEKSLRKALSLYPKSLVLWKSLISFCKAHSPSGNLSKTFQQ